MRDFPPELIQMVIDHLPEDPESPEDQDLPEGYRRPRSPGMSRYSTVSRWWTERTQQHHFYHLSFCLYYMGRWRKAIEPDPSGVSRHVRNLTLIRIAFLEDEDFDDHFRAFINVQLLDIHDSYLFLFSDIRPLALMGSSLVSLKINDTWIKSHILAALLVGLPHLRYLNICDLKVQDDLYPAGPPPRIPFFEGGNSFALTMMDRSPGNLDCIPPSSRFRELRIKSSFINDNPTLVNRWLNSSSGTLERFIVFGGPLDVAFDHLNLSKCKSLTYLGLPALPNQPGRYADAVFASLPSSPLSKVVLEVLASDDRKEQIDPTRWEKLDADLCRLAKRSKEARGGRKMEVEVYVPKWWPRPSDSDRPKNEWPMPNLEKEANLVVLDHEGHFILGSVDWYKLPGVV